MMIGGMNVLVKSMKDTISANVFSLAVRWGNRSTNKKIRNFIKTTIREFLNEGLDDTSWIGHNEETVTLRQILDLTKDIKVKEIEIEKLKKIVLSWDGNTEENEKIEKSDIQYPVLILMNDDNTIKYILDGNHRIQKSIKYNLPTVKAKLIKFSKLPKWVQNILG